jgi:hypothetical protein
MVTVTVTGTAGRPASRAAASRAAAWLTANRAAAEGVANRPPVIERVSSYPIGAGELTRTSMVRERRAADGVGDEVLMRA